MRTIVFALLGLVAWFVSSTSTAHAAAQNGIRVSGNHLVDGDGMRIRLIGVNRSGAEYACIRGWGIFEGPVD